MELSQKMGLCAEAHKWVSLSRLQSRANVNCSQCTEPFSSFFSDSDSALPSVRAFLSTIFTCLLSRAKHTIQKKNETVLKPSVSPRYTILKKSFLLENKLGDCFQVILESSNTCPRRSHTSSLMSLFVPSLKLELNYIFHLFFIKQAIVTKNTHTVAKNSLCVSKVTNIILNTCQLHGLI